MASNDLSVSGTFLTFQRAFFNKTKHLSKEDQISQWTQFLAKVQQKAESSRASASSMVPQKRVAGSSNMHPEPKRPNHSTSSISQPTRKSPVSVASRQYQCASQTLPISMPEYPYPNEHQFSSGLSTLTDRMSHATTFQRDEEVRDLTHEIHFIQTPNYTNIMPANLTGSAFSLAEMEDCFTMNGSQHFFNQAVELAPAASASTANTTVLAGVPMSRSNTNDAVCGPLDNLEVSEGDPSETLFPFVDHESLSSPASSSASSPRTPFLSHTSRSPRKIEIKPGSSRDPASFQPLSVSPTQISSLSLSKGNVQSRLPKNTTSQHTTSARSIAPRDTGKLSSGSSPVDDSDSAPRPTLHSVANSDGTTSLKAAIVPLPTPAPKSRSIFCSWCNDHPLGFHGEHELRRHIDRQHTGLRRVWICKIPDNPEPWMVSFLSSCKSCVGRKTYGANYNCAAHLRRTHFNPSKNKRGGRGKKSENRGGMGGGNTPPMEYLKDWMYETFEDATGDRVVVQHVAPGTTPLFSHESASFDEEDTIDVRAKMQMHMQTQYDSAEFNSQSLPTDHWTMCDGMLSVQNMSMSTSLPLHMQDQFCDRDAMLAHQAQSIPFPTRCQTGFVSIPVQHS